MKLILTVRQKSIAVHTTIGKRKTQKLHTSMYVDFSQKKSKSEENNTCLNLSPLPFAKRITLSHIQPLTHSFSIPFVYRNQTFVSPHSQFTWPSPWHWDWSQIDTDWGRLTMSRCWVRCGITGNGGTLSTLTISDAGRWQQHLLVTNIGSRAGQL